MRTKILPAITAKVEERQRIGIAAKNSWTLSLDGWTDVSGNSIYAVLLINGMQQHYLGNLELNLKRHKADVILLELEKLVGDNSGRIRAIVTDSPNVMKKLRKDYCDKNPATHNIKCVLHELNLLCKDVVKSQFVDDDPISAIVMFFSNSDYWRQKLKEWGQANSVTRFLAKNIETRWYSFVKMCLTAAAHENGFKYCVSIYEGDKANHPPISAKVIAAIHKVGLFKQIEFINQTLKPINDTIAILESQSANLGHVWPCFLNLNELYKNFNGDMLPHNYMEMVKFIRKKLNTRVQKFEDTIYIVAMYLSPSFRLIACSKKFSRKDIHKLILRDMYVRMKPKIMSPKEAQEIKQALNDYHNNTWPYHAKEKNAVKFWQKLSATPISSYALEIMSLAPSSASIERLFSKLSRTKTNYRNRMAVETYTNMGKIKLDALNEKAKELTEEDDSEDEDNNGFPYEPVDFECEEELVEEAVVDDYIEILFDTGMEVLYEGQENENGTVAVGDGEEWDVDELFSSDEDD